MELKIDQLSFEAAHWIPHHMGKCSGIHGHTYVVKNLVIPTPMMQDNGITVDFGDIKTYFANNWDHKFLIPGDDWEFWKHIYEECGACPVTDNRKQVKFSSVEGMAIQIQNELTNFVGHLVHFTLYEGLNQGVSV